MKLFSNYISNKILLGQSKITIATYLPKVVILALCPLLDNLLSFSLFHQIRNKHMKTVNPISHSVPVSVQSLSRVRLFVTPWTAAPPCPSPTPGVHPSPCPLSRWCHPTISSSVVSFSSCPQSFPASGSFQMNQLFASGGQNIVSASTSDVGLKSCF